MVEFDFDALHIEALDTLEMGFLLVLRLEVGQGLGVERYFVFQKQSFDEGICLLAIQSCLENSKYEEGLYLQDKLPHDVRIELEHIDVNSLLDVCDELI